MYQLNELRCGIIVRLMLDERSYITLRVRDVLGLQPEHVEQVQIKTFRSDATTIQTIEVIRITISLSR